MVFLQFETVCTWSAIEAINPGIRHKLDKILISIIVLGKHNEMITTPVTIILVLVFLSMTCHIHLASKNRFKRLKALLLPASIDFVAVVEELLYAEHVSMIGHRHTLHAVANSLVNEF